MDSVLIEKQKLHETLLKFPPFFTYELRYGDYKNMNNREGNRSIIGHRSSTHTAASTDSLTRSHNIINSSISEISNLPIVQDNSTGIVKKLSKEEIVIIMKELERLGCVEFQGGEKILISHFSPYQMADDMYKWAKDNYLIGDVETLQHIAQGQNTTPKHKFYKQPKQILLKVIDILEKSNKAAKIEIGNDISVKFL